MLHDFVKLSLRIMQYDCTLLKIYVEPSLANIHIIFSRSLFSLTVISSAAASNDDSTDVVFVKVLMNFPVYVHKMDGSDRVGCQYINLTVAVKIE